MTRTSLSRCSSVVLAALLVATLAAPAAAVSVGDTTVPDEGQVGTQVTATVTLTTLYQDPSYEQWQLSGRTELTNVTWVVEYYDQTGAKVGQQEFNGQRFSGASIRAADGTSEVRVRVTGTVPRVDEFSYDPPQEFLLMELTQGQQGGASNTVDTWRAHYYTAASERARTALDDAQEAIGDAESAGANPSQAEETFASAVDAYESGEFDLAQRLAERAQREANSAKQSAETRRLALMAGGVLLLVALVVGGVLYWRSQRDTYDKLG
ncbi:MAG: DUF4398 domain-containing protein [Haloferacaceae archaeon]